jgi:hypothetical protein
MPASKLGLNPAELDRVTADQVRATAATGQQKHVQARPQPQIPFILRWPGTAEPSRVL